MPRQRRRLKTQQIENEDLTQDLADAQDQVQAKESALADAQRQLADIQKQLTTTQAELDDVKFAAERLATQAEAALQKEDLKEAQRVADLLREKHSGTKEAARAAEIVTQIEKSLADKAEKEKKRLAAAAAKMRSETDAVKGVTFYTDKSTPNPVMNNAFYAYIGKKDDRLWLRLYVQFHGDEWLFVRDMVIKSGDKTWNITPDFNEWKHDNSASSVWEWYDGPVGRTEIEMLKAIAAGDQSMVRFNGDTYYSDYVITAAEKKAVQNVLDAFVALGGDLDNP